MLFKSVDLSILVCAYDMERELPRTLATLNRAYQKGLDGLRLEIVVLDNGSPKPLAEAALQAILPGVRVVRPDTVRQSPVIAINAAMKKLSGRFVGLLIDGARMLSPGVIRHAVQALRTDPARVVGTVGFHLGPDVQMRSMQAGYDQREEDLLLGSIPWQSDGYSLFGISYLAGSSGHGWFAAMSETCALFMTRVMWKSLGGLDQGFVCPGGGLANIDLWERAVAASDGRPSIILGEGTFHQIHGGAATGGTEEDRKAMRQEYATLKGRTFDGSLSYDARYIGALSPASFSAGVRRRLDEVRKAHSVGRRSFRVGLPGDALTHLQNGTLSTRYKGRRLLKSPFDLALYQRLLEELRPATIIEIGTLEGGSALWFRDQCRAIGLADTRLLSIDVQPPEMVEEGIELFAGDSLDPDGSFPGGLLAQLPHPWLVVEDSAHTYVSASAVLRYFDPLLAAGDVIVVEDGVVADLPEPHYRQFEDGPNQAVADFLSHAGPRYAIRSDLCDFYGPNLTWAPNAWLQKL